MIFMPREILLKSKLTVPKCLIDLKGYVNINLETEVY